MHSARANCTRGRFMSTLNLMQEVSGLVSGLVLVPYKSSMIAVLTGDVHSRGNLAVSSSLFGGRMANSRHCYVISHGMFMFS